MKSINRETKTELLKALEKEKITFINEDDEVILLPILNDIWNLYSLPSTDSRFETLYQDIDKHMIMNADWDYQYLFFVILKIDKDDEKFVRLLEGIVSYNYRKEEDHISKLVLIINSFLEKEKLILSIVEYNSSGQGLYKIIERNNNNRYPDLPINSITFYVQKSPKNKEYYRSSHTPPATLPSFVLVPNTGWNDYTYYTTYYLFYYNSANECEGIDYIKITDGESKNTNDVIQDSFHELPDNFCSLGQSVAFYERLKLVTGKMFESVLFALKDCAFFPDIFDKFENNGIYLSSLIRSDKAEQLRRQIKHIIYGYDLTNLYSFKYKFKPKYSELDVSVDFNFNKSKLISDRVYAIIGKNGTGKTQLVSSLPLDISHKNSDVFFPRPPLFSKIITVSYSIFDSFEIPESTSMFNYIYCGLRKIKNKKREVLSLEEQSLKLREACNKIQEFDRVEKYENILMNFIEKEVISEFIVINSDRKAVFNFNQFNKINDKLSSGQSILFFIISEIIANIRFDSLLLFDEPETHLHPNAISQLMNLIFELVETFDSYCIISTHSPLIVQEIQSNRIYVIERHANVPSIRKINIESFGENLTNITEEIFGNKEIVRQYEKIIARLVNNGKSYEEIMYLLESDGIPLSLNARLFIKSQLKSNEKYPEF